VRWGDRAAAAERAVVGRHLRRALAVPGTTLGVNSWPPTRLHRVFLGWNYWWQAHLLDCLVDAEIRSPAPERRRRIERLIRGIRVLNRGRWRNDYYDDMAWLALALQRSDQHCGTDNGAAIGLLTQQIVDAWSPAEGGGIPWRRHDVFKNTPANGPAAILLARTGHLERAVATADWIDARLRDPVTGLIWDGLRPADDGTTQFETTIYSYCQGVVLGAELEVAHSVSTPDRRSRIHRLVDAVDTRLSNDGVLTGHGGGDSGLFTGILARYLALVALELPGDDRAASRTRGIASALVLRSAEAAWANAGSADGLPVFGPDWTRQATVPSGGGGGSGGGSGGSEPERDLSVQLSGWMLLEAADRVTGADRIG